MVGPLLMSASVVRADSWRAPQRTEYTSVSGEYVLEVIPSAAWSPGRCEAKLYRLAGKERKLKWSRYLINNNAPVRAYVADSGQYVVTMDEWHHVGDLPLVIYGLDGRLIRCRNIEELTSGDDILHIKQTVSSYWWNEDALVFFSPDSETLYIRLHWGKLLMVYLYQGDLMDDEWYRSHEGWHTSQKKWKSLHDFAEKRTRELALEMLSSHSAEDRRAAAIVAGQVQLHEATPKLRQLLRDETYHIEFGGQGSRRIYPVRNAAEAALTALGEGAASTQPAGLGHSLLPHLRWLP